MTPTTNFRNAMLNKKTANPRFVKTHRTDDPHLGTAMENKSNLLPKEKVNASVKRHAKAPVNSFEESLTPMGEGMRDLLVGAMHHQVFWDNLVSQKYKPVLPDNQIEFLLKHHKKNSHISSKPILEARLALPDPGIEVDWTYKEAKEVLEWLWPLDQSFTAELGHLLISSPERTKREVVLLRKRMRTKLFWVKLLHPLLWLPLTKMHLEQLMFELDGPGTKRNTRNANNKPPKKVHFASPLVVKAKHGKQASKKISVNGAQPSGKSTPLSVEVDPPVFKNDRRVDETQKVVSKKISINGTQSGKSTPLSVEVDPPVFKNDRRVDETQKVVNDVISIDGTRSYGKSTPLSVEVDPPVFKNDRRVDETQKLISKKISIDGTRASGESTPLSVEVDPPVFKNDRRVDETQKVVNDVISIDDAVQPSGSTPLSVEVDPPVIKNDRWVDKTQKMASRSSVTPVKSTPVPIEKAEFSGLKNSQVPQECPSPDDMPASKRKSYSDETKQDCKEEIEEKSRKGKRPYQTFEGIAKRKTGLFKEEIYKPQVTFRPISYSGTGKAQVEFSQCPLTLDNAAVPPSTLINGSSDGRDESPMDISHRKIDLSEHSAIKADTSLKDFAYAQDELVSHELVPCDVSSESKQETVKNQHCAQTKPKIISRMVSSVPLHCRNMVPKRKETDVHCEQTHREVVPKKKRTDVYSPKIQDFAGKNVKRRLPHTSIRDFAYAEDELLRYGLVPCDVSTVTKQEALEIQHSAPTKPKSISRMVTSIPLDYRNLVPKKKETDVHCEQPHREVVPKKKRTNVYGPKIRDFAGKNVKRRLPHTSIRDFAYAEVELLRYGMVPFISAHEAEQQQLEKAEKQRELKQLRDEVWKIRMAHQQKNEMIIQKAMAKQSEPTAKESRSFLAQKFSSGWDSFRKRFQPVPAN